MPCRARLVVFVQIALVVGGFVALLLLPPARGELWLVPVTAAAREQVLRLALSGDARLVAAGPLGGSLVVAGVRARLWRPMLRAGVLVLAPPPAGCAAGQGGAAA